MRLKIFFTSCRNHIKCILIKYLIKTVGLSVHLLVYPSIRRSVLQSITLSHVIFGSQPFSVFFFRKAVKASFVSYSLPRMKKLFHPSRPDRLWTTLITDHVVACRATHLFLELNGGLMRFPERKIALSLRYHRINDEI